MSQSTLRLDRFGGPHVAVIMDGNGRWAEARGLPRRRGHRAGAAAVRRTVEAARREGVGTLSLFAFSSDNWKRPSREVSALFALLCAYIRMETKRCIDNGVRVTVVGRRDRLPAGVLRAIEAVERATAAGSAMRLRLLVDYSARDQILEAAGRWVGRGAPSRAEFARLLQAAAREEDPPPDVDLLIRTGGENRLSDFLLWESAYAELLFLDRPWPEFDGDDFIRALAAFAERRRRFGALTPSSGADGGASP